VLPPARPCRLRVGDKIISDELTGMNLHHNDPKSLASKKTAVGYTVLLNEIDHPLPLTVLRNGQPVDSTTPDLPLLLRPLALEYAHYSFLLANHFTQLLDKGTFSWPLLVREGDTLVPMQIEKEPRQGILHFDLRPKGILVRRLLDDGRSVSPRTLRIRGWLADFATKRLVRLASDNWQLWNKIILEGTLQVDGSCLIDPQRFSGIELIAAAGQAPPLDDLALAVAGSAQTPERRLLNDYKIDVILDATDSEQLFIHAVTQTANRLFPLDQHALPLFCEETFAAVAAPLRTLKRRRVIYDAYFAARRESGITAHRRVLRNFLQGPDFRKRAVVREAKEMIEEALSRDQEENWLLQLDGAKWVLQQRNHQKEVAMLEILYQHFGVTALRDAQIPGELMVPRRSFFSSLPLLLPALHEIGVELSLAGQTTVPAAIEIKISATAAGIDWFELRPEIRYNGALFSEEEWRRALADGLFEAGGELHLLDAVSLQALSLLAGMAPSQRKRKGEEVLRIPRLHILDCLALRRLGVTLELAADDAKILDDLENFSDLPSRPLPRLQAELRDYQRHGYDWLAFHYDHKFGACLADDMGLGKTLQAISLLAALQQGILKSLSPKKKTLPHLVVMPPSLLFNWESEIARFAPELRTGIYRGLDRSTDFSDIDVVLTSYDLMRRDIEKLAQLPFHVIIFDEAQAVKNLRTGITAAARRLQGTFKLALTGTPVENHLGEFWSIIDLVLPGLLGDEKDFGGARSKDEEQRLVTLIARTKPFVLRRSKEMIAAELPAKIEMELRLEMNEAQKLLYQQTVNELRGTVSSAYSQQNAGQARITALAALTRLRRLCLDPRLVGAEIDGAAPKITALCEQLHELMEEGHSVLVFSQFTTFLDLIEPALAAEGIPWLRLDGSTPVAQRKDLVHRFQGSKEPQVFLLSLKAGGRGLNLTQASYVIHLDPWWNPAVENQASDRAHRIGQTRTVTVLRLLMQHTVEEKMMMLKSRKEKLFKALLEEGRDAGDVPLTRADFEFLIEG
jgi:non-specific serine/threonine protein kinase